MHPYRNLLNVEQEILTRKQVSALRIVTFLCILFGSAILGVEFTVNFLEDDTALFPHLLPAIGIWTGVLTILTGFFANANSRLSMKTHPNRAFFMAIGQTATAAASAVSALGIFWLRCGHLRIIPMKNYFSEDEFRPSIFETSIISHILEFVLIVLYVISFMILGVSMGVSGSVLRSIGKAKLSPNSSELDEMEIQTESTTNSVFAQSENKKNKTQIISDIEATADGFYRRLENEDNDDVA